MDMVLIAQLDLSNLKDLLDINTHPIFVMIVIAALYMAGMYFPIAKPFIDAIILSLRGKPVNPDDLPVDPGVDLRSPTKVLAWLRSRIRPQLTSAGPPTDQDLKLEEAFKILQDECTKCEVSQLESQYKEF